MRGGQFVGTLSLERWWPAPQGDPSVAWVAGVLDGETEEYVKVCVEAPALPVSAERSAELLEKAREAIAAGPSPLPEPTNIPAPAKPSADEVHEQLSRVFAAWVDALDELTRLAEQRDPELAYSIYIRLVHVLNWAYTADQALQSAWDRLPTEQQVLASQDTDEQMKSAIANWQQHKEPGWTPSEEAVFRPRLRRQPGSGPYKDWASVVAAGAFHEEFFQGLSWISGKMRHQAAAMPIELRQMTQGGEPRWKWRLADTIAPPDRDKGRAKYVANLEGNDVLGLFSWLIDVFVDAEMLVSKLMRETEQNP